MTPVIDFMTSILFCRTCDDSFKCDGEINCRWLSPQDEANCSQQCSSDYLYEGSGPSWYPIPCACNKPGNMTCVGEGLVCYRRERGKLLVLFYFCKLHND